MKHRFYNKSEKEQYKIQITIAICAILFILLSVIVSFISGIYIIGIFTIVITLSILAPFFDTPSLKKSGALIYFSPLFITEKPKNGMIKIHGGTLFDYYFVIDKKMTGKQRTNFIIQQYLQGLLSLIEKHKNEKELKVQGTSYIMNERTAKKIGFKIIKTSFTQKFILTYNYFNIMISNSFAKNKVSFPNLNETKTVESNFLHLYERKDYIEKLNDKLKNTIANSK